MPDVQVKEATTDVIKPGLIARAFNHAMGWLAARGLAPAYCHELAVVGRKSGRVYTTPVNVLELNGKLWLVAARGHTQWARNAEAAGEVTLRRGSTSTRYTARETALQERPLVLKRYLETFAWQVQNYFAVRAGVPEAEFAAIAGNHPVFELIAKA